MKSIIFITVCLLHTFCIKAEVSVEKLMTDSTYQEDVDIVFIVKDATGKEIVTRDIIIGNDNVASLENLSPPQAEAKLGKTTKKRSVLIIYLKPSVNLLNKEQVLNHYNISEKYLSLPFTLDGKKVHDSKTMLVDVSNVEHIRVGKNERNIEIITKYYKNTQHNLNKK